VSYKVKKGYFLYNTLCITKGKLMVLERVGKNNHLSGPLHVSDIHNEKG
jgi:hypothetical protein